MPWFDDNAPVDTAEYTPPPVPPGGFDYDRAKAIEQVAAAYQQALGRPAQPGEAERWLDWGPGHNTAAWVEQKIGDLKRTEEAYNFQQRGGSPAGGTGANAQTIIAQWQQTHDASEGLDGLIAELNRQGIAASPFLYGSTPSGNEITLNGQKYKVKTGDNRAWWDPSQGEGEGLGALAPGSLLQPWQEQFSRPTFTPPPDFVAPTGDEVFSDPGFKFRMDQGRQALERSAAAKGTLLTTGTLKDLDQFSQGLASQEYGNVYGRKAGEYESKYGKAVDTFARDYNQALGEYGMRRDNFFTNQDRPFNKLTTLAGFGSLPPQNYAGQYGNLMMTGANNAGNFWTQGANANAAGIVGGSNAWNNAFGNLGNLGMQYASIYSNPWQSGGGAQWRTPWAPGYSFGTT